ncbi:MAG: hypothetical protein WC551_05435 [Patescibacteria group bacterium]
MIVDFVSCIRSALLEKRPVKVTIAGHEFLVDANDLRIVVVKELCEHAVAWAIITEAGKLPQNIPLFPGVIIDNVFFNFISCSFLLNNDLRSCHVRIGDFDVRISQGNGAVFHGKVGYLLRRTKEEADEFTKAYSNSCW